MVAVQRAYSRGQAFVRGASAAFAVFFGFVALFFTVAPKLWSSGQNRPANFFIQNTAHAEVPLTGDSISPSGDSSCDSGSDGAGDSCGV